MRLRYTFIMVVFTLFVSVSAQAHDPKEHVGNTERPDCAAMKGMDYSKVDNSDPVMQAIMKKCMDDDHHSDGSESSMANPQGTDQ